MMKNEVNEEINSKFNIRRIAISFQEADNGHSVSDENRRFKYKNDYYEKLCDFSLETLIYDVSLNSDMKIECVEDCSNKYLCIVLDISSKGVCRRNIESRIRLLQLVCLDDLSFITGSITRSEQCFEYNKDTLCDRVYNLLKQKHENDNLENFDGKKLKQHLRPSLRPYQEEAVKWMLYVESVRQEIVDYKKIKFVDCASYTFYINQYNLDITEFIPKRILPSGGILADEMGLGKTIEMLSLILLKQNVLFMPENDILFDSSDNGPSLAKIKKMQDKVLCICFNNSVRKKKTVKCIECEVLQHVKCVRLYSEPDNPHICPSCWANKKELIKSQATVIVTPATIKKQWYTEIMKHVLTPLKVLLYTGVSNTWISPNEISKYDIILTDYNILKREIYFSADNKSPCNFRNSKKYMRMESPLLKVIWYRVCLDEAQMVESSNTKASQMVKLLPAVHRWAITGTPIQKSLEDIRGLFEFLDVNPVFEKVYWRRLTATFFEGNYEFFIDVLGKVMWRTCKKAVVNELQIPEQVEKVHYIKFDDGEKLFYSNERQICSQSFKEKISKLKTESAYSLTISQFDAYTLKKILEPLKKLRQDCTVPMLLKFQNNQNHVKKLLQPQELLEHLKGSNELECKNQIRLMASNCNGLAAIHIIREEYEKAIKMYESVIGLAKEFSGSLSVDSLLQIHALHNIRIAAGFANRAETHVFESYISQQFELEWKYINTYIKKYLEALDCYTKTENILNEKFKEIGTQNVEKSFIGIFEELGRYSLSETLLLKIQEDNFGFANSIFSEYSRSIKTIEFHIFTWFRNVTVKRNELLKEFTKIIEIIALIKPKENLHKKVSDFVKAVFECHLKDIRGEDNDSEDGRKQNEDKSDICDLCKSKMSLNEYECLIFDKQLNKDTEVTAGTWNPCVQEYILKCAWSLAKNHKIASCHLEGYEKSLEIIEYLKKEYKDLSKLWSEIEFVAKAYDELEMCKMRLEVIDDDVEAKKSKNVIYQIPMYQVNDTFENLFVELNQSKIEFYKKLGRLKYIQHLEQNSEPDNCPICKSRPSSKYSVLDCGHIMCVLCLDEMTRYKIGASFSCPVCRAKVYKVYFVTRKPPRNDVPVKGEYSSKIQEILSHCGRILLNIG
ncbi:E3 ubiquitin-protein ligase SHPRH isoform X2 [Condylostylus longicornis]|uniref:E3 ubiquitin-protein ligase SHPRH isoform X2 n=1 Tax=Condylostylus longicornis TaxID=2530218 RepID=UPI00244DE973|nr:E3 ubiquitin-protein ligase SHPRH isoform X2 [Condylostylus longicornis]